MNDQSKLEEFTESVKQYIDTRYELFKYESAERTSGFGSVLISRFLITLTVSFTVLFISLGAAFYISARFNNSYAGFLFVAGFYMLTAIFLMIGRKKLLEKPMRNKLIRKIFSKN